MLKGFPPKAFIIGSQKSGTTQLANLLDQHPEICLARSKEPDIFSRFWNQGVDQFKSEFSDLNAICLDASTSYTCANLPKYFESDQDVESDYNGVVAHIHSTAPEARFIYIMRDPAARVYSAYWHQVRSGQESLPFNKAVDGDTYYYRTSHYYGQIEQYLEYFPKEQILFLTFEEFIKNPFDTAKQCFRFLGVTDDVTLENERAQNKSFVYGGFWGGLNRLLKGVGGLNSVVKLVKPLIPRKILEWGASKVTKDVPKISDSEYQIMEGIFDESIRSLEAMTGRDYDIWGSKTKKLDK